MFISDDIDSSIGPKMAEFVFYATRFPEFEHRYFGGWSPIGRDRGVMCSGSATLLGGGTIAQNNTRKETVNLTTLHDMDQGLRIAESVVAELASECKRVFVFQHRNDIDECLIEHWSRTNLHVLRVEDGMVGIGDARDIKGIAWLDRATAMSCSCVICSDSKSSALENDLMNAATQGFSISERIVKWVHGSYDDPEVIIRDIENYALFSCMGGLDTEDVMINRSDPGIRVVEDAAIKACAEYNTRLFNAGDMRELENTPPDYYTNKPQWQDVPVSWSEVGIAR